MSQEAIERCSQNTGARRGTPTPTPKTWPPRVRLHETTSCCLFASRVGVNASATTHYSLASPASPFVLLFIACTPAWQSGDVTGREGAEALRGFGKPSAAHTRVKMAPMRRPSASAAVAAAALALSGGSTASAFVVSGPIRGGLRSEVSVVTKEGKVHTGASENKEVISLNSTATDHDSRPRFYDRRRTGAGVTRNVDHVGC